jgi:hypothetical protein
VISISPDKAGPAVNALTRERSEWSGPGLAAMRAGFQAEIHNKGWQISIPGEDEETMSLNTTHEKRCETVSSGHGRQVAMRIIGQKGRGPDGG